jgi:hypothetical protein
MSKPYNHVRFRWWQPVDLDKVSEELGDEYEVGKREMPSSEQEISIYKDQRDQLIVLADTLRASLGTFRANLSQTEAKPFTQKDQKLREKIFEIYTHTRPTPFPWQWAPEPEYEKE